MIEIKEITKTFGERVLFKRYSQTIETGEFVIFMGPSGCGKTTLLNMVGAIEPIDSGSILVDGVDITIPKNELEYFRRKVGFLFQNFALVENKTVRENLKMVKPAYKSGITMEEALVSLGIADKMNSKVYSLSGGEQQRVALARLIIKQCDIILADEPTGSLDRRNAGVVMEKLTDLNRRGKTIVMVTHDDYYKNIGQRVVEL